jgi:Putative Zn-dependent protease, contains TPR repeats
MNTIMSTNKTTIDASVSTTNHLSKFEQLNWELILKILLALTAIAMVAMSFSYGLSGDEVDMNEYGKVILNYFTSFGSDKSVFLTSEELRKMNVYDYNRDNVVWYYGGLFDLLCAIVNKISPLQEYTTRHILNALAGFLAIYFASKITHRTINAQVAVVLVLLMFLSPFFLGHSMNNPKDIPFAASYIASIWCMIRFFDKFPDVKIIDYVWVIVCIGATITIRVGGIILIPYMAVIAGLYWLFPLDKLQKKIALQQYIKPIAILSVAGYFCGSLLWPYALQNPLSNPLTALSEMSNFKVNIAQIFEGEKIFSGELPGHFLIKSFIITNTFAILIGLCLGLIFLWSVRKQSYASKIYFIAFTALFPIAYILYSKSNIYHAWRHVLFVFPSIAIVAALGWKIMAEWLNKRKMQMIVWAFLCILLLDPLYFFATTYPNTVTYYNQLVGGTAGAYSNYEVDYYYNSLKQCADWFKKNELPSLPPKDTILIGSNAAHLLQHYFTDYPNVKIDYVRYRERNEKPWQYLFMHIALIPLEDIKSGAWINNQTIYKAMVQGKPLCSIMKKRSNDDVKALNFLNQNQWDSSIYYFKKYLEAEPDNTTILNKLSNVYLQTKNMDSALSYIQKSYDINNQNLETQVMYGMISLQGGDAAKALQLLNAAVQQNPQDLQLYYYLGIAQFQSGQAEAALNTLNTASQDPEIRSQAYKVMGDIYTQMGNMQQANKLYQAAGM